MRSDIPSVMVFSEPGSTHEGDKDWCLRHIAATALAGAQGIKFQWVSDAKRLADQRGAQAFYTSYKKIAFPLEWHEEFREIAHRNGLLYGCTIYLSQDVELLGPYLDFVKISSFEADHANLLDAITTLKKPIYLSLGMKDEQQIADFLARFYVSDDTTLHLLYCVSGYPCPIDQLNLAVLTKGLYAGLSDHSADISVGGRAYAAGARIFEVHTRLFQTPATNLDYGVSLAYWQFQKYIEQIKEQQRYFGSPIRTIQPIEREMLKYKANMNYV